MMQWKKKKTLEKTNSLHRQRQKKLFVSEKGFIPPPKKIMVLIPYLLTTSIAFNFVFKKAKASNKLHAVLHVSSMKQTLWSGNFLNKESGKRRKERFHKSRLK